MFNFIKKLFGSAPEEKTTQAEQKNEQPIEAVKNTQDETNSETNTEKKSAKPNSGKFSGAASPKGTKKQKRAAGDNKRSNSKKSGVQNKSATKE